MYLGSDTFCSAGLVGGARSALVIGALKSKTQQAKTRAFITVLLSNAAQLITLSKTAERTVGAALRCVNCQDILYTLLSRHPLHFCLAVGAVGTVENL